MSLGELAAILDSAATRVRPELVATTETFVKLTATYSRSLIGHYQPGWAPLADSTLREKAAAGYAIPNPLLRTGEMRDSIVGEADASGTGAEGAVGASDPKAIWHELGTSRMPPRPFLSLAMMNMLPTAEKLFNNLAIRLLIGDGL